MFLIKPQTFRDYLRLTKHWRATSLKEQLFCICKVSNAMPFFSDIHAQYRYYSLSMSLLINTSTLPDISDLLNLLWSTQNGLKRMIKEQHTTKWNRTEELDCLPIIFLWSCIGGFLFIWLVFKIYVKICDNIIKTCFKRKS